MIELPSKISTPAKVQPRFNKAFSYGDIWYSMYSDVYEYFLPNRNLFDNQQEGQNKMDKIFDSTALEAIQEGANKLVANVAPPWRHWAKIEASEKLRQEMGENIDEDALRENLDEQAKIAFDFIHRSNFDSMFFETCLDLLVGTGTIHIDENDSFDSPLNFRAMPIKGVAYEDGPSGDVETHWLKYIEKARNIERKWIGFKPSSEMAAKIKDDPDCDVHLYGGVVYCEGSYYGLLWVKGEDSFSWVQNYEYSSPLITERWSRAAGENRGRGPAIQSYPDVRSLNKAKEFVLQKAAIDLAGMYTAVDDGVTNPYNIAVSPGIVIPVGSNDRGNPSISRLDTGNDLRLAEFEINDLKQSIKKAFFNDLRDPDGPVRSATEVAIEARELTKRIGSSFGRINSMLNKILKRVFYILQKKGLVNLGDRGLYDGYTTLKFTSPLATAQDQDDLLATQQAVEFTAMTAGPEMVQASFAIEKFGEYAAKKTGMAQELVRSEVNRNNALQAGAQAEAMQLQQGKQPQGEV